MSLPPSPSPLRALASGWQKPRGFAVDVVPLLVYLLALFWFGLTPLQHLPGPEFRFADKVWHALAFGGLAGLAARAFRHGGRTPDKATRDAALSSIALGGLLEVLQSFTAFRSADWADFAADALGAWLMFLLLGWLSRAASAERRAPNPAE